MSTALSCLKSGVLMGKFCNQNSEINRREFHFTDRNTVRWKDGQVWWRRQILWTPIMNLPPSSKVFRRHDAATNNAR